MSYIPTIESQSPAAGKRLQEEKLRALIDWLSERSPFYQQHFERHGIHTSAIARLEDLANIPPTTKDDLQQRNGDFLCVPRAAIREYTSTSGTLGKPVTVALTAGDLQRLAYNEYISFACAGGSSAELYQLMLTLDRQFMAGIAYYEGIRKLEAGLVRVGPGLPAMQWETIERLKPTAIVAVPSFMVKLLEYAWQNGIDPRRSSVRKAICIGESIRTPSLALNKLGKRIQDDWDIALYSTYASTEMQTAFTECRHGVGGHHHPELLIVELLDEHDRVVRAGESGEVTITTLGVEGMPLLRYKTGDIATAHEAPCACGRTTMRLGPIEGRRQQMIKLKGTTLYPPAIFEILHGIEHIDDYAVEVTRGEWDTDELTLHILTEPAKQERLSRAVAGEFQARLRVVPAIRFVTAGELEKLQFGKMDRKVRKFLDRR